VRSSPRPDVRIWFAALDRDDPEPFMAEGRNQPTTPTGGSRSVSHLLDSTPASR